MVVYHNTTYKEEWLFLFSDTGCTTLCWHWNSSPHRRIRMLPPDGTRRGKLLDILGVIESHFSLPFYTSCKARYCFTHLNLPAREWVWRKTNAGVKTWCLGACPHVMQTQWVDWMPVYKTGWLPNACSSLHNPKWSFAPNRQRSSAQRSSAQRSERPNMQRCVRSWSGLRYTCPKLGGNRHPAARRLALGGYSGGKQDALSGSLRALATGAASHARIIDKILPRHDDFSERHIGPGDKEKREMLDTLGVAVIADLCVFVCICFCFFILPSALFFPPLHVNFEVLRWVLSEYSFATSITSFEHIYNPYFIRKACFYLNWAASRDTGDIYVINYIYVYI